MVRTIPLSRRSHVTGFHPVKAGHGMVPFESTLERDFLSLIANWPCFHTVVAQPITVPWFDGNRWRRYTPDFRLELMQVPNHLAELGYAAVTFIEVKYADDFEKDKEAIQARLDAVRTATDQPAIIANEHFIRQPLNVGEAS